MNNEPVAWILTDNLEKAMKAPFLCRVEPTNRLEGIMTPIYTQEQLEEARKLGMQQERALWNLSESTQEIMNTHPLKEQLSNGHLSDCAVHNEPALKNKPCDCGFEPKFNLWDLKHEDYCRYFDDGEFCTCGAEDSALVEWYRHKEVTNPVKELTDEEILSCWHEYGQILTIQQIRVHFARAILRKAQEK